MLAKVIKGAAAESFVPIAITAIGGSSPSTGLSKFVVPAYDVAVYKDVPAIPDTMDLLDDENHIETARAEAARIIAQAEEHSQIIQQVALDKAAHESEAAIEAKVGERSAELRTQLAETITNIATLVNEIRTRAETEVIELAIHVAKKIVGHEVTVNRDIALELVKISLGKLHNRSIAEVHLNPDDLLFVETHCEKLDFRGTLNLVSDKSISAGGCLIHTETGDIDARIESQFDEIAHGLFA